ncbi:MAG: hypothetical protein KJ042_12640, partial [Deltaproteobacteria bacterium]|nr:hypothetical protein [Deltaproteobacteria bacterium]
MKARFGMRILAAALALAFAACGCGDDDDDNNDGTPDDDTADDDSSDDDADDDDDTWPPLPDDDDNDDDDAQSGEVVVYESGDDLVIANNRVSVRYHRALGRYSVLGGDGGVVIDHAESLAQSNVMAPAHKWRTGTMALANWTEDDYACELGEGKQIALTYSPMRADRPDLTVSFALLDHQSAVLVDMRVDNTTDDSIKVGSMYALLAGPPAGRLLFGEDRDLRFLGNGTLTFLEFISPIFPGTTPAL